MGSVFIDQSVVTGGTGTVNVPIPVTALAGDLVIAFGIATGINSRFFTFGPGIWNDTWQDITTEGGGAVTQRFSVRKIFAGETDLVLTQSGATVTLVQVVLQVWRGAAQLFAGATGEYNAIAGSVIPGAEPSDSSPPQAADPTAVVGGNIAFSACATLDAAGITTADLEGFTNSALESHIRIDYRGFTQGEGGSTYPAPVYDFSTPTHFEVFSFGFSGAPDPVSAAAWDLPPLTWTASGEVEPFNPTGGVMTKRFDAGEGSAYWMVAPVVDSGVELRSKTIKSVRQVGRRTNVSAKIYGYDIDDGVNLDDLEAGTNSSTGAIPLDDSTQVAQSARENCNVKNSVLWTVRIEGDDTGRPERDEIHEIAAEVAEQGVRR